jgi:hypothetical protein
MTRARPRQHLSPNRTSIPPIRNRSGQQPSGCIRASPRWFSQASATPDYKNAGTAIRKALAEAGDSDKFVWPRETGKKLAVFQVHFVTGATAPCRRYIVTIVKNGWTTTAPPMEKCGIKTAANERLGNRPNLQHQPAKPHL